MSMPASASFSQDGNAVPSDVPTDVVTKANTNSSNDDITFTGTIISAKSTTESTIDDTTITIASKDVATLDDAAADDAMTVDVKFKWNVDEFGLPVFVRHMKIQGRYITAAVFVYFCELARTYKRPCYLDNSTTASL